MWKAEVEKMYMKSHRLILKWTDLIVQFKKTWSQMLPTYVSIYYNGGASLKNFFKILKKFLKEREKEI